MPVLWGACPTLFDPTQAPGGRHTAFMWVKTPYHLELDAQEYGRALLDLWTEFAPNLAEGAVLNSFARSPREIAVKLPNMLYGDLGRLRPPLPRFGTLPVAGRRIVPVRRVHSSGRQHHGSLRLQRRIGHCRRSRAARVVESARRRSRIAVFVMI